MAIFIVLQPIFLFLFFFFEEQEEKKGIITIISFLQKIKFKSRFIKLKMIYQQLLNTNSYHQPKTLEYQQLSPTDNIVKQRRNAIKFVKHEDANEKQLQ